jgi:metallo-beta-lactamase class B
MMAMKQELLAAGFEESEIAAVGHPDGTHAEWYWKREFPAAYEWLFGNLTTGVSEDARDFMKGVEVFPNPGGDTVYIELPEEKPGLQCRVFTAEGKLVRLIQPDGQRMSLTGLPPATYLIGFYLKSGHSLGMKRLMVQK